MHKAENTTKKKSLFPAYKTEKKAKSTQGEGHSVPFGALLLNFSKGSDYASAFVSLPSVFASTPAALLCLT